MTVPRHQLFHLPPGVTLAAAAGLPSVFFTAYYAMFHLAGVAKDAGPANAGKAVLVHSAAGGVGSILVQLGRLAGCRVVGVVGAAHKVEYATKCGCDVVIDKSSQDLWAAAAAAAPGGYHAVFDANGVSTLHQSFEHLAATGRLVVYGFHSMLPRSGGVLGIRQWLKMAVDYLRTPRFSPLDMTASNRSVMAFNLSFMFDHVQLLQEGVQDLLRWVAAGVLSPAAVTVYPLREAARAHAAIESGMTVGKIVLQTHSDDGVDGGDAHAKPPAHAVSTAVRRRK